MESSNKPASGWVQFSAGQKSGHFPGQCVDPMPMPTPPVITPPISPPTPLPEPLPTPPVITPPAGCEDRVLVMSYVEWQQWDQTYEKETALERGTIFPELDLPFVGEGACPNE